MKRKLIVMVLLVAAVALCARPQVVRPVMRAFRSLKGTRTVAQRVEQYGADVRVRLKPDFDRLGVAYPPKRVVLAAFKMERLFPPPNMRMAAVKGLTALPALRVKDKVRQALGPRCPPIGVDSGARIGYGEELTERIGTCPLSSASSPAAAALSVPPWRCA